MKFSDFFAVLFVFISTCCAASSAQTDSIFSQAIAPYQQNNPLGGSLKRTQLYKGIKRESAGTFYHMQSRGTVYQYSSPMNFKIICTDSVIYSIDLSKKQGFRFETAPNEPLQFYDLDPLYRLFSMGSNPETVQFLGSIDSMTIFGKKNGLSQKPSVTIGINNRTKAMDLIEFFDTTGKLLQQVFLGYSSKRDNVLPETIVTKMVLGNSLLTDSLTIKYKSSDTKASIEQFSIPDAIQFNAK